MDLKLVCAKDFSMYYIKDFVLEACFQYFCGFQLEDDVADLDYMLNSVIQMYLEDWRKYKWRSSLMQIVRLKTISRI